MAAQRRLLIALMLTVALGVAVIPVVNILSAPSTDKVGWTDRAFLYNVDFVARWISAIVYRFGVSINPSEVIIGRNGWLYLGDRYSNTLSVTRRPPTEADDQLANKIKAAAAAWEEYLGKKGIGLFRIAVCPNKSTIYPEHLPQWAQPAEPNIADALFVTSGTYIDLRAPLVAAKSMNTADLYYKTDTHWNNLGAAAAFRAFANALPVKALGLQLPTDEDYVTSGISHRQGGDLANFIRLSSSLVDPDPQLKISHSPPSTKHQDFETGKVVYEGKNLPVAATKNPLLVKSTGSLNNKKVLWLRDSFGTAMSPLMTTTFSEVLQVHWIEVLPVKYKLAALVDEWKPDYVFITVVERDSRSSAFTYGPPVAVTPWASTSNTRWLPRPDILYDIKAGAGDYEYVVTGVDPQVIYSLPARIEPATVDRLQLDLKCRDNTAVVPIQLFWLSKGSQAFDEEHSAHFNFPVGRGSVDLGTVPGFKNSGSISRLRIDLDSGRSCTQFTLPPPGLS